MLPRTYQPRRTASYAMSGGDSKSVEEAYAELVNAVAAQPGANIVDKGTKADGRYLRAEFTIPKSLPFGSDEIDDVEFLIAAPGTSDPPSLVDYHSVTRAGGTADNKRPRAHAIRADLRTCGRYETALALSRRRAFSFQSMGRQD